MSSSKTGLRRGLLFFAACCAAYVISAAYLNIYGPDAPLTMEWYGIDAAQQGFLITLQAIGGSAAAVYLGLRGEVFNKIYAVTIGCLVLGVSCILMSLAPPYGLLGTVATVCGFGFTVIDINVNGVIADVYPEQKGTLLSIGHAFYGAGGMIAPSLVALTVSAEEPRTFTVPFLIVGIVSLGVFAWAGLSGRPLVPQSPYSDMQAMKQRVRSGAGEVFRKPEAWALLAAGILYFTFQLGVASWLPSWGIESGMTFEDANFLTSGFFAGQLVMGFLCALLLRKIGARRLFAVTGMLSAVCMAVAILCGNPVLTTVLVVTSGFLQGTGVITLIMVLTDAFPHRTASASSIQVIGANTAAVTAPLWMGAVADTTGFAPPLLVSCAMYVGGCVLVLQSGKLTRWAEKNREA